MSQTSSASQNVISLKKVEKKEPCFMLLYYILNFLVEIQKKFPLINKLL